MALAGSSDGANETSAAKPAPAPSPPPTSRATSKAPAKTARHWRVLRNALVSRTRDETSDETASSLSTEFFPQFASESCEKTSTVQPAAVNFEWHKYAVTKGDVCKRVFVHEKKKCQTVSLAELFSHKLNNGVDNTGNIRTWPSEQILLSYMLKQQTCRSLAAMKGSPIVCCELGAGMAGLASLGLVAHNGDSIQQMLVTDGNPQSVQNLKLCIKVNTSHGIVPASPPSSVQAELLRWDRSTAFPPSKRHQFDLLFASDCLFFEDFHEDLAYTLKELLKPSTGVCFLLQPSRNGSMERFCTIAASPRHALQVRVVRDYDPEITRKHKAFQASHHSEYVPDVHFPVLLEVRAPQAVENVKN
jgi:calmodulin-lysine N-methyltransferase